MESPLLGGALLERNYKSTRINMTPWEESLPPANLLSVSSQRGVSPSFHPSLHLIPCTESPPFYVSLFSFTFPLALSSPLPLPSFCPPTNSHLSGAVWGARDTELRLVLWFQKVWLDRYVKRLTIQINKGQSTYEKRTLTHDLQQPAQEIPLFFTLHPKKASPCCNSCLQEARMLSLVIIQEAKQ